MFFIVKVLIAALVISLCSWLSGQKPSLAGFLVALPLGSMLTLLFSYLEWHDSTKTAEYAVSIFAAVPVSLLFFIPFLLAQKFQLNFWTTYFIGIALLTLGFFIHKSIFKY